MKKFKALAAILVSIFFVTGLFAQDACGPQLNVTNAGCNGFNGAIVTTFPNQGVQSGYSFAWTGPNNFSANTQNISGVNTGTYTLVVTYFWNGAGCQSTNTATVGVQPSSININTMAQPVSCNGGNNGSINIDVWGGVTPYVYSWSNGSHSEDIANLTPGNYTVTVNDNTGCTAVGFASVGQPAQLQTTITTNNGSCGNTASAMATATGGTAPYTYQWSTGSNNQAISGLPTGTYTVTVTDSHGCTNSKSTSVIGGGQGISFNTQPTCDGAVISGLTAGTYTVTITNADGCTKTATFTVACNLAVGASVSNTSCNGSNNGAINLAVTGGVMPYTYHWNTNSTTQNLSNLPAGTYTVTVTDATGNTKTVSATVNQPAPISVSANVTNVSVNGGSNGAINLNVNGGIPGYTYHWSNGAGTKDIFNLSAGTYNVTVTDVNWCTATLSAIVNQPPPCVAPNASFAASSPTGFIAYCANLSTGSGPLSYHWWFGDGSESFEENPTHTYQNTGMYLITLKTTNACGEDSETKNLLISGGPTPVVEPGSSDVSLTLSPNPTTDFVSVNFTEFDEAENVYLFNETGQLLKNFGMLFSGEQINVQSLPTGTYFLSLEFEGKVVTRKVIKQGGF